MPKSKIKAEKKVSLKKINQNEIIELLTATFLQLKDELGQKKFEKKIYKAAKILTSGAKKKEKETEKKVEETKVKEIIKPTKKVAIAKISKKKTTKSAVAKKSRKA